MSMILGALVGGFAFHLRGGGFVSLPSSQLARLAYAVLLAGLAAGLTQDPRWLALAIFLFVGAIFPWWSTVDLGRVEGNEWRDRAVMLGRGLLWTAFTLPMFWWPWSSDGLFNLRPEAWWWAMTGLACPVFYEIGWRTRWRTISAEALFGAWLGGSLAYALA